MVHAIVTGILGYNPQGGWSPNLMAFSLKLRMTQNESWRTTQTVVADDVFQLYNMLHHMMGYLTLHFPAIKAAL